MSLTHLLALAVETDSWQGFFKRVKSPVGQRPFSEVFGHLALKYHNKPQVEKNEIRSLIQTLLCLPKAFEISLLCMLVQIL